MISRSLSRTLCLCIYLLFGLKLGQTCYPLTDCTADVWRPLVFSPDFSTLTRRKWTVTSVTSPTSLPSTVRTTSARSGGASSKWRSLTRLPPGTLGDRKQYLPLECGSISLDFHLGMLRNKTFHLCVEALTRLPPGNVEKLKPAT